jgi:hypothetical protein
VDGPRRHFVISLSGDQEGIVIREFYVTCRVEKWFVDEGSETHGPYLSKHDAIADAIEAAELLAKPKKAINVVLKLRGAGAELIWTSKKPRGAKILEDGDAIHPDLQPDLRPPPAELAEARA